MTSEEPDNIPPNLRLLMILEEVAKVGVPVTPTDVKDDVGLPKPTIHRLFSTLEAAGFLQRELDGRSYTAGRRLRRLSANVLSSLRVRTARLAVMHKLADTIGETCNLAVPERDSMIYLDRVETKWPLRIQLPIGSKVPFHCTASGKIYLSTLSDSHLHRYLNAAKLKALTPNTITDRAMLRRAILETRGLGYGTDNQEFVDGMVAIAVPIQDDQERLISTLAFHAPVQRLTLETARDHVSTLRAAAQELSRLLIGE